MKALCTFSLSLSLSQKKEKKRDDYGKIKQAEVFISDHKYASDLINNRTFCFPFHAVACLKSKRS